MNDGEREFALCQIFTEALVICVLFSKEKTGRVRMDRVFECERACKTYVFGLQIHVIISYLEMNTNFTNKTSIVTIYEAVSIPCRQITYVNKVLTFQIDLLLA